MIRATVWDVATLFSLANAPTENADYIDGTANDDIINGLGEMTRLTVKPAMTCWMVERVMITCKGAQATTPWMEESVTTTFRSFR